MTYRCLTCRRTWAREALRTDRGFLECPSGTCAPDAIARVEPTPVDVLPPAPRLDVTPELVAYLERLFDMKPRYRWRSEDARRRRLRAVA